MMIVAEIRIEVDETEPLNKYLRYILIKELQVFNHEQWSGE